ncbi:phosphodiesterase [Parasedimentitalea psychrophila]|uniref:Phosphodiesterase n=1 Tax=Parasedimentitalea psychrophila TaxID=2997337 RepID=A0A9Y2L1A0_9RHOB|nr:phosphodiesterase [Parasedimentitalea psychrophila]WIY25024.1 phosphodiesterase [Parasedimentitalea psychrophila]
MKLIHLTDLHLTPSGAELAGSDPSARLSHCLKDIEQWHSDASFCVISGDLADRANPAAYSWLKEQLAGFSIPTFLMVGNHDDRSVFLSVFDDHPRDDNGFVQHSHQTEDSLFLFLDTTSDGANPDEGQLCPQRLDWLRTQLINAGDTPVYLFMHHPPFDIGITFVDDIKLVQHQEFADVLKQGRNIRHVFYGHVHRTTYVQWNGVSFTSLPSLNHQIPLIPASTGTPYSSEPPGYGVVLLNGDQMTVHVDAFLNRGAIFRS